jgi:DNA-directed RNA polymerase subunit H (RpoH/RPB5)
MADPQYTQYENLRVFAKDWRNYDKEEPVMPLKTFQKEMQVKEHITMRYAERGTGRPVVIYLLSKGSKCVNVPELRRMLNLLRREPATVMIISENPLKVHSVTLINSSAYAHLNIRNYPHNIFKAIIPLGPKCHPHEKLEQKDAQRILNEEIFSYLVSLPKIHQEDPQCIWIGAELGDIVKVTQASTNAMGSITYRVVVPRSGRVSSFQNYKKKRRNHDLEAGDEVEDDVEDALVKNARGEIGEFDDDEDILSDPE